MKIYKQPAGRRGFLKSVAALGSGIAGLAFLPGFASARVIAPHPHTFEDKDLTIIGPKEGYSPQIGTLVSEMAFMRSQVLNNVKGLTMELGDEGRKTIKGNSLDFYLNLLNETRESTLAEFRKRDDAWLMSVDKTWPWGPTNNYCKWFHVCEHESNHDGQVKLLKARLPGAKAGPTS
jgi:hypothetical protein